MRGCQLGQLLPMNINSLFGNDSSNNDYVIIIAEIGNNHNGSFDLACQLVNMAKDAGADYVKFQLRDMESLYRSQSLEGKDDDLGSEYVVDLLQRISLSTSEHMELRKYCAQKKIGYLCTPWDHASASTLASMDLDAFKIASADFENIDFLQHVASFGKPLILSTGMASHDTIVLLERKLKALQVPIAVLHCNSSYPAPHSDLHLRYISVLRNLFGIVGYSGHERGLAATLGAVALGARVIERHFTLDTKMEGPDHLASLMPREFKQLVNMIRELTLSLGTENKILNQGQLLNKETLGKSLVASRDIKAGEILKRTDIDTKSPGKGLSPLYLQDFLGKKLLHDMNSDDYFYFSAIKADNKEIKKSYHFNKDWGIPVRYHDFNYFARLVHPKLWEFHFSYSDLKLSPDKFLTKQEKTKVVVHAPELFANSELLDLTSLDKKYRERSLDNMKFVIAVAENIRYQYFPDSPDLLIVTNVGGYSEDGFLTFDEKKDRYEILSESLCKLEGECESSEVIPQNMAPFPWHFGGQRFQNLLLDPDEIKNFCDNHAINLCVDISHAALLCNFKKIRLSDYLECLKPYIKHIHFSDASGTNGEGLQWGEGDLDMKVLSDWIETAGNWSFIPEVWQGHTNGGEGMFYFLDKMQKSLIGET